MTRCRLQRLSKTSWIRCPVPSRCPYMILLEVVERPAFCIDGAFTHECILYEYNLDNVCNSFMCIVSRLIHEYSYTALGGNMLKLPFYVRVLNTSICAWTASWCMQCSIFRCCPSRRSSIGHNDVNALPIQRLPSTTHQRTTLPLPHL